MMLDMLLIVTRSKRIKLEAKINFSEGIKLTFDWYNNNKMYYNSLKKRYS